MANTVTILSYANTFGDWVVNTNALAKENNDLAANNYTKSNGTMILNDPTLGLQVGNSAIFAGLVSVAGTGSGVHIQNNLQVDTQVYLTNTTLSLVASGQANVMGPLMALGANNGLVVANSAVVGGNVAVTKTTTSNNIVSTYNTTTNTMTVLADTTTGTLETSGNVVAGANLQVVGKTLTNDLQSNTNMAAISASLTGALTSDLVKANTSITTPTGYITLLQANTSVNTPVVFASASVNTPVVFAATSVNTASVYVAGNVYSTGVQAATSTLTGVSLSDTVVGNTSITTPLGYIQVVKANTSVNTANVFVTGTTATSGLVVQSTLDATAVNTSLFNNVNVNGNFVINGTTIYNSNTFTINAASNVGLKSYFNVNRGISGANASIRWDEANTIWTILDVNNSNYYRIHTDEYLSSSNTLNSTSNVATSAAVYTVNSNLLYTQGVDVAQNTAIATANTFLQANDASTLAAAKSYALANTSGAVFGGNLTVTGTITSTLNGNAATVTNGVYTTGSYSDPTWITALSGSKISGNISGNAGNITAYTINQSVGTGNSPQFSSLGVGGGAPGGSSLTVAGRIFLSNGSAGYPTLAWTNDGAQDTGLYWGGDGYTNFTNNGVYSGQMAPGGNFNIVGYLTAAGLGGGAATGTGASGTWGINISGNAATVTNGVYNNGSTYGINISGNAGTVSSITSGQVTGALGFTPVHQGGGSGQGSNTIYIGWGGSQIYVQVDGTNFGATWPISINGNAATATNGLTTGNYNSYAPQLNGTGAYGSWAINITGTASYINQNSYSGGGAFPISWASSNTSYYTPGITITPNTGTITATYFSGTLQGNCTGSSSSCTGNAATVTNGVYNNGATYGINITGNAGYATSAGSASTASSAGSLSGNSPALGGQWNIDGNYQLTNNGNNMFMAAYWLSYTPTSGNVVPFDTQIAQQGSNFSDSGGTITVVNPGLYEVQFSADCASSVIANITVWFTCSSGTIYGNNSSQPCWVNIGSNGNGFATMRAFIRTTASNATINVTSSNTFSTTYNIQRGASLVIRRIG